MPKKKAPQSTRLYELVVTFPGRDQQLFYYIEEKDRQRLLRSLDDRKEHAFHELGGAEGLECLVNTAHIHRLNVLDYLAGIPFEAEPELSQKEWEKKFEEREASDERVILRLWLRGDEEPHVLHEIEHAAWCLARTCLNEDEKFICFRDEDGEEVLYGTDHLEAIEMIDPFYLTEEQVEQLLARYDKKAEPTNPSSPSSDTPSSSSS